MNKLFDVINPNFFNVLSSPNKEIYVDCIFIIYESLDSVEDSFQGDREFVMQRLIHYFDELELKGVDEFDDRRTSRQKALAVINYFKECGWLGEEELGDYKTSLNLFDYTIRIVDVLKSIQDREQIEYTGEIFTVYSVLQNFTIDEGVGIIEQAYDSTNQIIKNLKGLKANIYRYYYDITLNQDAQDLQNLLEKLLVEYKNNFFDNAYYNLKTKDSLPRYKKSILDKVLEIYNSDEILNQLALQTMEAKKIEDYDEAFHYIEDKIRFIADSFNAFDYLILAIDRKNEQYVSAAASKILFLTNHSDDIEGIFNRIFKIVVDSDENTFEYDQLFNLFHARNLDTESLYTQRRLRIDTDPEPVTVLDDLITDEYRRKKLQFLMKNNIYGKKEINRYVLTKLNHLPELEASELPLETEEDYIKLILIFLYSRSVGMDYHVEMLGRETTSNFATFNNFLIKRGR
ncbi:MAG TPA: hypothetical protein GX003_01720 [Acholeplasmataceae bacterium]|jgi:hypothetical protein|nr:hypothetical protein [Acholeplasmataceae bacterium]